MGTSLNVAMFLITFTNLLGTPGKSPGEGGIKTLNTGRVDFYIPEGTSNMKLPILLLLLALCRSISFAQDRTWAATMNSDSVHSLLKLASLSGDTLVATDSLHTYLLPVDSVKYLISVSPPASQTTIILEGAGLGAVAGFGLSDLMDAGNTGDFDTKSEISFFVVGALAGVAIRSSLAQGQVPDTTVVRLDGHPKARRIQILQAMVGN